MGSYGLGAGSVAAIQTNAIGSVCTGVTTLSTTTATNDGHGDYLDIVALQPSTGTTGTLTQNRICGVIFNAATAPQTAHATACSWAIPFKVGVHFDADDVIGAASPTPAPVLGTNRNDFENDPASTSGAGLGYSGFYLAYWQNTC